MFKAAVFDMDGTILDTLTDLTDSVNHCLGLYGCPPVSREETAAALGNGAGHLVEALIEGGKAHPAYEDVLKAHIAYYEQHCTDKTAPYSGILPAMRRLKEAGVKMAIVSNKGDGAVRELSRSYFDDLVETAVGEREGIRRKPAPDTVIEALRLMDVPIEEAVYVGDTEVDVMTASNAGMPCILVSWGFLCREELENLHAYALTDSADEMADLILGVK